jgi:hypothetical protein
MFGTGDTGGRALLFLTQMATRCTRGGVHSDDWLTNRDSTQSRCRRVTQVEGKPTVRKMLLDAGLRR